VRIARAILLGEVGANVDHTCWFCETVIQELVTRYGFDVIDRAYVDETRFSYRLWRPTHGSKPKSWKDRLRPYYAMMRNLLWQPVILINSVAAVFRPCLAETLCVALQRRGGNNVHTQQARVVAQEQGSVDRRLS
jgi:hypothetical protein